MNKRFSSKIARRACAVALGLTMAMSTMAYASPQEIYLVDGDGVAHRFKVSDITAPPVGSTIKSKFLDYLSEIEENGGKVLINNKDSAGVKKFIEYNKDLGTSLDEQAALPGAEVPGLTTFSAVSATGSEAVVSASSILFSYPTQVTASAVGAVINPVVEGVLEHPQWTLETVAGFTIETTTGAITCTAAAGTYNLNISVADGTRTGTYVLTLNVVSDAVATVTGVTVTPNTASVEKGKGKVFTAEVAGTGAYSHAVVWSVSGSSVSTNTTISQDGLLTIGEDETSATVTVVATSATNGAVAGSATVTVTSVAPTTDLVTYATTASVAVGATTHVALTLKEGAVITSVATVSSDAAIATATIIGTDIVIEGKAAGTVDITVKYDGTALESKITVTVNAATLEPTVTYATTTSVAVGATVQIPLDLKNGAVITSVAAVSSDAAIATATITGTDIVIEGKAAGTVDITVKYGDTELTSKITVTVTAGLETIAVTSATLISPTSIKIVTADTSGTAIAAADFVVVNDGTTVSSVTVIKVSATEFTLTLPTAVAAGKTVVVTTQGKFAANTFSMTYYSNNVSGCVTGYALDSTSNSVGSTSLAGVVVKLILASDTSKVVSTETDATGNYTFLNVASGTYNLQFIKDGYSTDIDNSSIYGVQVKNGSLTGKNFALKSTNTTIESSNANVAAITGSVVKVSTGTTVGALEAVLKLTYGTAVADSIKIVYKTTTDTAVNATDVVTTANAISVIAEDGLTPGDYTIDVANSDDLAVLGVAFDTNAASATVGSATVKNTVSGMYYRVSTAGTIGSARLINGTTFSAADVRVGTVIRVWSGTVTDVDATGKYKDLTVALSNIAVPAKVGLTGSNQVKQGSTVAITPITNTTNIVFNISTASTAATYATSTKIPVDYVAGEAKITLPAAVAENTYYVYAEHISGAVSAASDALKIDNTKPVLDINSVVMKRTSLTSGSITFASNEVISGGAVGYGFFAKFSVSEKPTIDKTDIQTLTGSAVKLTSNTLDKWDKTTGSNLVNSAPSQSDIYVAIVAVDKAGNMSDPLQLKLPSFVAGLENGTYTVLGLNGDVTKATGLTKFVSLQDTNSVKVTGVTQDYLLSNENIANVLKLLPTTADSTSNNRLTSGDSFTIASGKITEIKHIGTTAAAVALTAEDVGTTLTLSGSAASVLTVSGNLGSTNVHVVSGGNKINLSGVTLTSTSAVGATTANKKGSIIMDGAQTENIIVGIGSRVETSSAGVAILNGVSFMADSTVLTLDYSANDTFSVYNSLDNVTINAQVPGKSVFTTDTNITVKFVVVPNTSDSYQSGAVTVTGKVTSATGILVLTNQDNKSVGKLVVSGGSVDIQGFAVINTTQSNTHDSFTVSAGAISTKIVAGGSQDLKVGSSSALTVVSAGNVYVTGGNVTLASAYTIAKDKTWNVAEGTSLSAVTSASLTIAVGGKLTIASGAFVDVNTSSLINNGTLEVLGKLSLCTTDAAVALNPGSSTTLAAIAFANSTQASIKIMADANIISGTALVPIISGTTIVSSAGISTTVGALGVIVTTGSNTTTSAGVATVSDGTLILKYTSKGYTVTYTTKVDANDNPYVSELWFVEIK